MRWHVIGSVCPNQRLCQSPGSHHPSRHSLPLSHTDTHNHSLSTIWWHAPLPCSCSQGSHPWCIASTRQTWKKPTIFAPRYAGSSLTLQPPIGLLANTQKICQKKPGSSEMCEIATKQTEICNFHIFWFVWRNSNYNHSTTTVQNNVLQYSRLNWNECFWWCWTGWTGFLTPPLQLFPV